VVPKTAAEEISAYADAERKPSVVSKQDKGDGVETIVPEDYKEAIPVCIVLVLTARPVCDRLHAPFMPLLRRICSGCQWVMSTPLTMSWYESLIYWSVVSLIIFFRMPQVEVVYIEPLDFVDGKYRFNFPWKVENFDKCVELREVIIFLWCR